MAALYSSITRPFCLGRLTLATVVMGLVRRKLNSRAGEACKLNQGSKEDAGSYARSIRTSDKIAVRSTKERRAVNKNAVGEVEAGTFFHDVGPRAV